MEKKVPFSLFFAFQNLETKKGVVLISNGVQWEPYLGYLTKETADPTFKSAELPCNMQEFSMLFLLLILDNCTQNTESVFVIRTNQLGNFLTFLIHVQTNHHMFLALKLTQTFNHREFLAQLSRLVYRHGIYAQPLGIILQLSPLLSSSKV
ncbi:hypothetical protein RchiOBHm_Chr1g0314601 [Rosa chinensis]|uniref:Uncharacterized protein n=1 Tax=Rosa chinensis TaxID=74649 RepID=A0A2P6S754_ROSCH|nr:hypothetical protein RchiOBHm_Chr1g0314601 [Rosa chinensis]